MEWECHAWEGNVEVITTRQRKPTGIVFHISDFEVSGGVTETFLHIFLGRTTSPATPRWNRHPSDISPSERLFIANDPSSIHIYTYPAGLRISSESDDRTFYSRARTSLQRDYYYGLTLNLKSKAVVSEWLLENLKIMMLINRLLNRSKILLNFSRFQTFFFYRVCE